MRPYKGVEDAIAAMAHVRARAVLLVAGECWESPDALPRRGRAAGVADRVVLDFRYVPNDEIPALFTAADAVVLPYRTATQSAVAALAFAYDRPVVATRAGGLAELVEDGVTGALAPPADPGALAAAIDRVLADTRDWGAAIADVRARRSWARYVDLIDRAAAVARSPPGAIATTHAVLDVPSRRAKAAKLIAVIERAAPPARRQAARHRDRQRHHRGRAHRGDRAGRIGHQRRRHGRARRARRLRVRAVRR